MYRSKFDKNHAEHYYDNQLHRMDGPAVEYYNHPSQNKYFIHGQHMTKDEWQLYLFVNGIKNRMLSK